MRELAALIRYVGLYGTWSGGKSGKGGRALRYLLVLILGVLPPAFVVYLSNHKLYTSLQQLPSTVAQRAAPLFFNLSATMFSLFYVVGFVGNASYSLSRNEELEYLLTMPIRRTTLVIYSLLFSSSSQFLTLGFYLGAVLGYVTGTKASVFAIIARTLLQLWFLSSVASFLALLLGGSASRTFVRRLNIVLIVALIFVYFGFSYLQGVDVSRFGESDTFARWFIFVNSDHNVLAWSFSRSPLRLLTVLITAIGCTVAFVVTASKVAFEPSSQRTRNHSEVRRYKNSAVGLEPVHWKDLKLLQRNEQFLFLILYPFVFGLFMVLITTGATSFVALPFLAVGVFYCAVEAGILTSSELRHWEIVGTLPLKVRTLILPKVLIPILINLIVFVLVALTAFALGKFSRTLLLILPIYVPMLLLSSLTGSYFSVIRPGKARNQPFDLLSTFVIQGITLGIASAVLPPLNKVLQPGRHAISTLDWSLLVGGLSATVVLSSVFYERLKSLSTFKKSQ